MNFITSMPIHNNLERKVNYPVAILDEMPILSRGVCFCNFAETLCTLTVTSVKRTWFPSDARVSFCSETVQKLA